LHKIPDPHKTGVIGIFAKAEIEPKEVLIDINKNHLITVDKIIPVTFINSKILAKHRTPFFRRVQTSVQNLTPQMIFSNDQFHIVLKCRNLEICKQSSFLIIDEIVF